MARLVQLRDKGPQSMKRLDTVKVDTKFGFFISFHNDNIKVSLSPDGTESHTRYGFFAGYHRENAPAIVSTEHEDWYELGEKLW